MNLLEQILGPYSYISSTNYINENLSQILIDTDIKYSILICNVSELFWNAAKIVCQDHIS